MTKEEFKTIIKPIMLLNGKESQFIRTALLGNFQKWNEQKQLIIADVSKCTCEIPDPRMKNSENGISGYCVKCVKPLQQVLLLTVWLWLVAELIT